MSTTIAIDRGAAIAWYRRNRARSEAIFDLIAPDAYYSRPIALRNPIVFYEGHLPAFSVIAFLRRGLRRPPVDPRLEALFARGIDPDSVDQAAPRSGAATAWPSRDEVRAFARKCDDAVLEALEGSLDLPAEGLYTALEHEAMHQETLLYMWHRLPYEQKRPVSTSDDRWSMADAQRSTGVAATSAAVLVPAGDAVLGADPDVAFGWDNEFDAHSVRVPAFTIDTLPVTNAQFLEFVAAGGYTRRELWSDEGWQWIQAEHVRHPAFWIASDVDDRQSPIVHRPSPIDSFHWRGMFERLPLHPDWPVYVSQAEATAYTRWKGRRLMTEAEFHRAAYPEGGHSRASGASRDGYYDFAGFDPAPVGSFAPNPLGISDLVGNGWEWTSTVFGPFAGFKPMASYPEYSADFFDGKHYVLKGASPVTPRELVRPSFRNWFRATYPYVYAKFRTVA